MVLRWHAELEWLKMLPAHERIPRAHWQVSFMELALDFEAFAERQLPPAPQSKYTGGDLSLQQKGRVLRRIVTLVGRAIERESFFPVRMTHHCCSPRQWGRAIGGAPRFYQTNGSVEKLGEAPRIRGSQMGTKAKSTHGEAPCQDEGHGQETGRNTAGSSSEFREEEVPSEGWSKKRAEALCNRLLCEAREGSGRTEGRNLRAVTGGGSGRSTAPIFTPPATREGARKKETRRWLTKSWVCERHGNPPCPRCVQTHRGVRHCCSRGRHGHPKDACTPRHTSRRARLASQRTPGLGGTPALKRSMGRIPPGAKHARHGPAQPPAPSNGGRGIKRQRETPPPPTGDPASAHAWRAPRSGTAARARG